MLNRLNRRLGLCKSLKVQHMFLFVADKLLKAIEIVLKVHSLQCHTRVPLAASQVHPLSHLLLQLVV